MATAPHTLVSQLGRQLVDLRLDLGHSGPDHLCNLFPVLHKRRVTQRKKGRAHAPSDANEPRARKIDVATPAAQAAARTM